jgi:hypothetical protein
VLFNKLKKGIYMKSLLICFFIVIFNLSSAYSISYSVQDLGLGWSEESIPVQINENGTVIGKLKEREKNDPFTKSYISYTDFMWTPENGLILINSKQASENHFPFLNNNDEIVGVYWNKIVGWFQKYQEENLYKYNIKEGVTGIPMPKHWEGSWTSLFYTPWASNYSTAAARMILNLNLLGYTDQDELLVKVQNDYEILQKGEFKNFKVDKNDALLSINCEGRIAIIRIVTLEKYDTGRNIFNEDEKNSERAYGLYRSLDTKEFKILDYYSEYPEEAASSEALSVVIQVLDVNKAIGFMLASKDETAEGYLWSTEKGYIRFKNFIPLVGNKLGHLIGKQIVKQEGQDRLKFLLWIEGNFYDLEDLIVDGSEKEIKKIVSVVDINSKGQILIRAEGLDGKHAYLLNLQ